MNLGNRLLLNVLFASCLAPVFASPAARHVRLELSPPPAAGTIILQRVDTEETLNIGIRNGAAETDLEAGTHWLAQSAFPGWWMPPETVLVEPGEGPLVLARRVWKTGILRGTAKIDRGKLARSMSVTIEEVPASSSKSDVPNHSWFECPVEESGKWSCEIPVGTSDLALRMAGFVPVYRWGLRVRSEAATDTGLISFKSGASVSGWVVSDERGVDLSKARARLVRPVAGSADAVTQERLERPAAEAAVRKDGFFQLTGISGGTYRLIVDREGLASAALSPVTVHPDSESAIRVALRLTKPMTLRISVEPPADWTGHAWRLRVDRLRDYGLEPDGPPVFNAPVDAAGVAEVERQTEGTFTATVGDASGNDLKTHTFVVSSVADADQRIEMKVLHVTGEVRLGDQPVAAEVWFGGHFGTVRILAHSDSDGKFQAVLPIAGDWPLEIEATEPRISVSRNIVIDASNPHVVIALPNTSVTGRVVDDAGKPVIGAAVLFGGAGSVRTITGTDGAFQIEHVPVGKAQIQARSYRDGVTSQSDPVWIDVADDGKTGPFELRILPSRKISGRVVSIQGPVAGAAITIFRTVPAGGVVAALSDIDGNFAVNLPASDTSAIAVVSPPGHIFRAYRIPLDGSEIVIHVAEVGGTLSVTREGGEAVAVWEDGMLIAVQDLIRWAMSQGILFDDTRSMVFPNISPGLYRFCGAKSGHCKEVTLAPGGHANLDMRQDD